MMGIPTAEQIKAMADEELAKFLDSLQARETQGLEWLDQLLANKFRIEGSIGGTKIDLTISKEN
jgi:hypothetical protein